MINDKMKRNRSFRFAVPRAATSAEHVFDDVLDAVVASRSTSGLIHYVYINNLLPGTTYHYLIGDPADPTSMCVSAQARFSSSATVTLNARICYILGRLNFAWAGNIARACACRVTALHCHWDSRGYRGSALVIMAQLARRHEACRIPATMP